MPFSDAKPDRTPVAIVGGGPVGLALALGLARHGIRSVLLEREPSTNAQSRAPALHVRTMEVLKQWSAADAILEAGTLKRALPVYLGAQGQHPFLSFDFAGLNDEADDPGVVFLEQGRTERILADALRATGMCDLRFSAELVALETGQDHAVLTVRSGTTEQRLTAGYVVGCDGTDSFVRQAVGLPFDGVTYPLRPTLADVRIDDHRDDLPWPRFRNGRQGITGAQRLGPQHWRIIRVEDGVPAPGEPVPHADLRRWVGHVLGGGPMEVLWASRFTFQRRDSPRYRHGPVLLAGDAAHAFPPANGQGMNAGIQDAHNLAWKLAHALRGGDADRLLDSYDLERRGIVGTVASNVSQLTRIGIQSPRVIRAAALQMMRVAMAVGRARRRRLRSMAMIDLDLPASPLLDPADRAAGLRLPNPMLRRADGRQVRLHDLLPHGPSLLDLSGSARQVEDLPVDATIRLDGAALADPTGSLRRMLGDEAGWILVRPDLHVAWATTDPHALRSHARMALGW